VDAVLGSCDCRIFRVNNAYSLRYRWQRIKARAYARDAPRITGFVMVAICNGRARTVAVVGWDLIENRRLVLSRERSDSGNDPIRISIR